MFEMPVKIKHLFIFLIISFIVVITIIFTKYSISVGDIIIAISTLISPIVALQIQFYTEKSRNNKKRKMEILRTLMANRKTPLNYNFVEAINMIGIEFYGDNVVKNSLDKFFTIRYENSNDQKACDDSIIGLIQSISTSLDLNFTDDDLRRNCYRPNGHVDLENTKITSLINLSKAVNDGKLHIILDTQPCYNLDLISNIPKSGPEANILYVDVIYDDLVYVTSFSDSHQKITNNEFIEKFGEEKSNLIFKALKKKHITHLSPFLNDILLITSERGHTLPVKQRGA